MSFSMPSQWAKKCPYCGIRINVGDMISKDRGKWAHANCPGSQYAVSAPTKTMVAIEESKPFERYTPVAIATIEEPEEPEKKFEPSKYQTAIYDFIGSSTANGVVIATAGAGKTTTIRNAIPYLPSNYKIAAIAFNKRNSEDFKRVMPKSVSASTFHSLGLKNVKRHFPDIKVDEFKSWKIMDWIGNQNRSFAAVIESDGSAIKKIVDLSKNTMSDGSYESMEDIAAHYGITPENQDASFQIAKKVLEESKNETATADFADMLYWCAIEKVGCEKFDFVLQDEAQDATQVQIEFARLSLAPGGRLLAVGDPKQAIYGWAGSAIDSIDQLTLHHNAANLPLSITYRLPLSHVEHVNRRFPDVEIEARPGAPDGEIRDISHGEMVRSINNGDLVICRVNAPLVAPAFDLIRNGRKAVILGKDIGKGLETLLAKMEKRSRGSDLIRVLVTLQEYAGKEIVKLMASKKFNQANTLEDQVETIIALSDSCNTVAEVKNKISAVFQDTNEGVIFSSIHRAKGNEARHIYFLRPDLCPHPMAKEPWQKSGEENCLFVALTRSKNGLYFVQPEM